MAHLQGKRVLLVGAEIDRGRECAAALTEAGATLALVSSTAGAEAAFAVKRLALKLGAATSQAIDATNEAAIRIMLRQVSKVLGGLDACVDATSGGRVHPLFEKLATREMERSGGGVFIVAEENTDIVSAVAGEGA